MTAPLSSAPSNVRIAAAAARLQAAAETGVPCEPVRDLIGRDDIEAAYAVQLALTVARQATGARIVGHKIGLTSPAVQAQLGVDRPDFGVLFEDMAVAQGEVVGVDGLLQPRIEAEIAFVLAADIVDPDVTAHSVRPAVAGARAALEIVDSRIADWDITFGDTVADNASSGRYTVGDRLVALDDFEPAEVFMTMTIDGEVVSTGSGADCLGDPLAALAWLARTAIGNGTPLRAGETVLSGALGPMRPVTPGARVHADITALGSVSVSFANGLSDGRPARLDDGMRDSARRDDDVD